MLTYADVCLVSLDPEAHLNQAYALQDSGRCRSCNVSRESEYSICRESKLLLSVCRESKLLLSVCHESELLLPNPSLLLTRLSYC